MSNGSNRFSRRRFLGTALTAGAAVAAASCTDASAPAPSAAAPDSGPAPGSPAAAAPAGDGPVLKIVHWKHFVPDYDKYFDKFAKQFAADHKCQVIVDYVGTADLPTAIAADISRGGGHDIFHLNGTGAWLYDQVLVDVSDVADRLSKEFGGFIPGAESIGKVGEKWLAIPHWFIRYPMIINRGYFTKVGADWTSKSTWDDVLKAGAKLKKGGYPYGIPFSQTPDSNDNLIPLMLSFGATMFDKQGKVEFAKKEILDVLKYGKEFYDQTMTDEVLSWDDSSNNRFIASGKGSMVCNPISAYRTAAKDNPDVYRNLEIQLPPIGPKGRVAGARTMSYGIYNFSKQQTLAKEFLYTMNKEGLAGMEASTGYNHPFLKALLKKPMPVIGHEPKLNIEQDFHEYVQFVGSPGPMTKTATTMYAKFIVPTMFAEVAKGKAPRAAMEDAEKKLRAI